MKTVCGRILAEQVNQPKKIAGGGFRSKGEFRVLLTVVSDTHFGIEKQEKTKQTNVFPPPICLHRRYYGFQNVVDVYANDCEVSESSIVKPHMPRGNAYCYCFGVGSGDNKLLKRRHMI